jgi:Uma2 family endonuclease
VGTRAGKAYNQDMPVATPTSIEDFERLSPPEHCRYELVEGEVVELTFPTPLHNVTVFRVSRMLAQFVEENGLGIVFPSDTGFVLSRDPGTLRGPDVAFVCAERAAGLDLRANIPGAPDLAVEVISPTDTIRAMRRKVDQYLAAGCRTVWVLDPDKREVEIFECGTRPRVLLAEDSLECPELLPGFGVQVCDFFPPAAQPSESPA